MAKSCVFCGRSAPEVKMSNEHVLRAALAKYCFGAEGSTTMKQVHTEFNDHSTVERTIPIPKGSFSRTINRVCKICNEGWLNNEIEKPVEAQLASLMLGFPTEIDAESAARLSLWAAKTTAVRSLMDRGHPSHPTEDFKHIFEQRCPPPNSWIWIASIEYCVGVLDRIARVTTPAYVYPPAASAYLATFLMGHLGIFVAGGTNNDRGHWLLEGVRQELDSKDTLPIWPPMRTGFISSHRMALQFAKSLSSFTTTPDVVIENSGIMLRPAETNYFTSTLAAELVNSLLIGRSSKT